LASSKRCFNFATENENDIVFNFRKDKETEIKNKIKNEKIWNQF